MHSFPFLSCFILTFSFGLSNVYYFYHIFKNAVPETFFLHPSYLGALELQVGGRFREATMAAEITSTL